MLPHAGQACTEESGTAAEGWREGPQDTDEEVPCIAALCQDPLHHLHSPPGGPASTLHLPWTPSPAHRVARQVHPTINSCRRNPNALCAVYVQGHRDCSAARCLSTSRAHCAEQCDGPWGLRHAMQQACVSAAVGMRR